MIQTAALLVVSGVLSVALLAVARMPAPPAQAPSPDSGRVLQGRWSAVGWRHTLPTEGSRKAAVVELSGAVSLSDATGTRSGFQGEAIGFDDGGSLSEGRAVWTDAHGDRVFSTLHGDSLQTGRRIAGTITGGTGRYAGTAGEYTLTWQYIVAAEDGLVQGMTVDLRVRFRSNEIGR